MLKQITVGILLAVLSIPVILIGSAIYLLIIISEIMETHFKRGHLIFLVIGLSIIFLILVTGCEKNACNCEITYYKPDGTIDATFQAERHCERDGERDYRYHSTGTDKELVLYSKIECE